MLLVLVMQNGFSQVSAVYKTTNTDYFISNNRIYKTITDKKASGTTTQIGAPQLPIITQNFALPQGSVVTNLSVTNGSKTQMGGG